jgi:CTP:molybdopterin cytidylyltransferase MocA
VIAGLILAAGAGTRFGSTPKLLAELDGRPLLEWAVRAQCEVEESERVVVVLGANGDAIVAQVDFGRAEHIVCEDWAGGQSASLRCGLTAVAGAEKAIVTLGDQPLLTAAVIRRFVDQPPGTRAVYGGVPGHPVVLGPEQMRLAAGLTGDRGARGLLAGGRTVECSDIASARDVDTPEDLQALGRRRGEPAD